MVLLLIMTLVLAVVLVLYLFLVVGLVMTFIPVLLLAFCLILIMVPVLVLDMYLDLYLKETDWILLSSIFLLRTSWIWPLSGPCFTFSRPIRYKNFGVRMRSRFTVCGATEQFRQEVDESDEF